MAAADRLSRDPVSHDPSRRSAPATAIYSGAIMADDPEVELVLDDDEAEIDESANELWLEPGTSWMVNIFTFLEEHPDVIGVHNDAESGPLVMSKTRGVVSMHKFLTEGAKPKSGGKMSAIKGGKA